MNHEGMRRSTQESLRLKPSCYFVSFVADAFAIKGLKLTGLRVWKLLDNHFRLAVTFAPETLSMVA